MTLPAFSPWKQRPAPPYVPQRQCITDRAAIEAAFAADCEAEAIEAMHATPPRFVPTTPDDGDEGSTAD